MDDAMQRLSGNGRYEVEREIGHGGMATVYLARDTRHSRQVAVKVLHPELAAVVGAERFLREIAIAAQLQHPNILTLIDSGEADGLLYYVMPFVQGESLRDRLVRAKGPLPISEATWLLRGVVDALAHAHSHGVVHRDIKPDNVMIADRHALVVDFGIAKAMREANAVHRLTSVGMSLGTPAYMAPEQAAADPNADHRVDLYAAGVLAYEMVTGRTPFTGSPQAVLAAQITAMPDPPSLLRPDLPPALEAIILRCLEKSPESRYATAADLLHALEAMSTPAEGMVHPGAAATRRAVRGRVLLATAAGVVILAGAGYALTTRSRDAEWLRATAIPEIKRLNESGVNDSAWILSVRALAIAPDDSVLISLLPTFSSRVAILSEPAGATVHRTWYDDSTGWEVVGTTPTDTILVPSAISRYRIEKPGYRSVLFATSGQMFAGRTFVLDSITAPDSDMVRVQGGRRVLAGVIGLDHVTPVALEDYLIDRHEVTNASFKKFVDAGGYRNRDLWEHAFVKDGTTLPFEQAMPLLIDRTGRPGPATWEAGSPVSGHELLPVAGISWYEAAAYAKYVGKALPTVFHWAHAAGIGASQYVVPGSNFRVNAPATGSSFRGLSPTGVFDMAGNVREWSFNAVAGHRYILGGGWSDEPYQFTDAYAQDPFDRSVINGVRLLKQLKPDTGLVAARRDLAVAERDFNKETPVGDAVFDSYRRMYDYDPASLSAKVETRDTTHVDWIVEKVSFAAAYGGERVPAYLYLPKRGTPPFQAVVFFPGSNALQTTSSAGLKTPGRSIDFLVRGGRAVIYPIYKSTYERNDSTFSDYPDESIRYRDHGLMWGKDVRRTVDYLASRRDIDTTRIAYYGLSWGAFLGGVHLAIEPRFKAAVLYVAGLTKQRGKPEVEPINFLPRIRTPTLMLNGQYDHFFPIETSQKPMFRLLGTPAAEKRYVVYPGGHNVPREKLIAETLGWLDKYLGPVH